MSGLYAITMMWKNSGQFWVAVGPGKRLVRGGEACAGGLNKVKEWLGGMKVAPFGSCCSCELQALFYFLPAAFLLPL